MNATKKNVSAGKLLKYKILGRFPGRFGQRYFDKYSSLTAMESMPKALEKCAGMVCIDLGANVGEFSEMMAARASRVIAFEPDPWSLQRLVERVGGLENVEIVEAAAGLEDGSITLYRHEDFDADPLINSQSSSVIASKKNVSADGGHVVTQVNFLRFLRELDEDIGILKIDIEGAEVDLLESLFANPKLFRRIRYVFAETHEKKIPGHRERVRALREKSQKTWRPVVNLYWH
ncbi:FkbM family methyltransferase [Rhodobacterales bacterium]|nr:FkbM family methyltransferase [Rhodobacterales bacterium]